MPFLVLIFSCFYFSYFLTFSIFVLVFEKIVVKFPWFAAKNHQSIQCDTCDTWTHCECKKINKQTYKLLQNEKNTKWFCVVCTKGFLAFSNLTNEERIHTMKSEYWDQGKINKLENSKISSNFLHLNIFSLLYHFSELPTLLSSTKVNFDIIGVSKSRNQESIEDYWEH